MRRRRRATADAGVGHRDDLARAVVARGVGRVGAHYNAGAVLVVLLADDEVLDPGDVEHAGDGVELAGIRGDDQSAPLAAGDLGAGIFDLGRGEVDNGARLDAYPVEVRAVALELRMELVGRVEEPDPGDLVERLDVARGGRRQARLEGKVGQVAEQLGAERLGRRAPRRLDRAGELHDVIAAHILRVLGDFEAGRDVRPLAERRREGRGAQLDRRRIGRSRRNDLLRRGGQRQRRKQDGYRQA